MKRGGRKVGGGRGEGHSENLSIDGIKEVGYAVKKAE
jgi:hypothetical protein